MNLFIEEEGSVTLPFNVEETARLVVEAALELEQCPYEAEVNLLLTTDEEIHKMNLEFRQIDRPTDVLSFPMVEYDTPGEFSCIDEESDDLFDPGIGRTDAGRYRHLERQSALTGGTVRALPETGICISHRAQHASSLRL